ncbi:hypothetical protein QA596_12580 [Balneolales bacterium ANBcel1]|nr:hypothetical protein [Balneolales bacterium ANBcel1]
MKTMILIIVLLLSAGPLHSFANSPNHADPLSSDARYHNDATIAFGIEADNDVADVYSSAPDTPKPDQEYIQAMQSFNRQMDEAMKNGSRQQMREAANGFLRIAEGHPDRWHPPYYASLAYALMGYMPGENPDEQDAFFTEAERLAGESESMVSESQIAERAEITVLKGFIMMGQLSLRPSERGQTLSPRVFKLFGEAIQMNEKNPRAQALMARMQYATASYTGQSTDGPCEVARNTFQLFDHEQEFQNDPLAPNWGRLIANQLTSMCE